MADAIKAKPNIAVTAGNLCGSKSGRTVIFAKDTSLPGTALSAVGVGRGESCSRTFRNDSTH